MSFATTGQRLPNFLKPAPQAQPNPIGLSRVEVVECFHPGFIPAEDADGNAGISAVRSAMLSLYGKFSKLNERRAVPNELLTQAANAMEVVRFAEGLEKDGIKSLSSARSTINTAISSVRAEVEAAANLKPDACASEYRARFLGMKPAERQAALTKAVADENRPVLAAIFNHDELITGVSPDLCAALKEQFLRKAAPVQMAKLDKHLNADQRLRACENKVVTQTTRFFEGTKLYAEKKQLLDQINGGLTSDGE